MHVCKIGWRIKPRAKTAHFWEGSRSTCGERFEIHIEDWDEVYRAREDGTPKCPRCIASIYAATEWVVGVSDIEADSAAARAAGGDLLGLGARAIMYGLTLQPSCYLAAVHKAVFAGWRFASVEPASLVGYDDDSDRYPAAVERVLAELPQARERELSPQWVLRAVFDAGPEGVGVLDTPRQGVAMVDWFKAAERINVRALMTIGRPLVELGPGGRLVVAAEVPADIIEARAQAAEREAGLEEHARLRREALKAGKAGKPASARSRAVRKVQPRAPKPAGAAPLTLAPGPAPEPASQSSSEPPSATPPSTAAGGRDPSDARTIDLEERAAARATPLGRRVVDGLDALPTGRTLATVLDDGRVVAQRRPGVAVVVDRGPDGAFGWLGQAQSDGVSLDALAVAVVEQLERRAVEGFEQPELLAELAPVRAVGLLRGGRVLDRQTGMGHQPGRKVLGLIWDIERPVGEPTSPAWRSTVSYDSTRIEAHRSHDGEGWHLTWVTGCGYWCWGVPRVPLARALLRIRAYLFGVSGDGLPPPISEDALREELRGHLHTIAGQGPTAVHNLLRSASVEPFLSLRAALPAPGEETPGRPAVPRRTRSRAARVDAALRRRGLRLERNPLPAVPEHDLPASVRWTARRTDDDYPLSPSKVDPVAAARFALAFGGADGDAASPIVLQPPWVMSWDGTMTHDAMPGPRGAFGSIPMAQQIGAWLDAITMQFPLLRKLGPPGCSTGWVSWGRFVPDVLGGYIQIVYDPPTAHGNRGPARLKPPEGVVGPYVRLGDEVVEVPEPCPHLLAVAAARLAALALGAVDQRSGRSGTRRSQSAAGAQPDEGRAGPGQQPDDRQTAPAPEPEASQGEATSEPEAAQPMSQGDALRKAGPVQGELPGLVVIDEPRRPATGDAAARVLAHWQDLAPKTGRKPKVPPEALLVIRARLIAEGADDHDGAVAEVASARYGKKVSRLVVQRAHTTASERLEVIVAELGADVVAEGIDALGWAPRWEASA